MSLSDLNTIVQKVNEQMKEEEKRLKLLAAPYATMAKRFAYEQQWTPDQWHYIGHADQLRGYPPEKVELHVVGLTFYWRNHSRLYARQDILDMAKHRGIDIIRH